MSRWFCGTGDTAGRPVGVGASGAGNRLARPRPGGWAGCARASQLECTRAEARRTGGGSGGHGQATTRTGQPSGDARGRTCLHKVRRDAVHALELPQVGVDLVDVVVALLRVGAVRGVQHGARRLDVHAVRARLLHLLLEQLLLELPLSGGCLARHPHIRRVDARAQQRGRALRTGSISRLRGVRARRARAWEGDVGAEGSERSLRRRRQRHTQARSGAGRGRAAPCRQPRRAARTRHGWRCRPAQRASRLGSLLPSSPLHLPCAAAGGKTRTKVNRVLSPQQRLSFRRKQAKEKTRGRGRRSSDEGCEASEIIKPSFSSSY